jgi:hypothetical protein
VNVAEATALSPLAEEAAIALSELVLLTLMAPLYTVEAVVGVLPSVV